jgi:hypothetical protein
MSSIKMVDYKPYHQPYFEKLNRAWIEKYFEMEQRDINVLTDPEEYLLKDGGAVLIV